MIHFLLTHKKKWLILLLGFSCGLPLPLTLSTFSAFLHDYAFTLHSIGLLTLTQAPYILKPLWSPFLDHIKPPLFSGFGKRRGWLIIVQFFLFFSILLLGQFNPQNSLALISLIALSMSFFSASQDIIVDALRVESFKDDEQGVGVAYYTFGYRVAMFVATAGALYTAHVKGWEIAFFTLAILSLIGMLAAFIIDEPHHKTAKERTNILEWFRHAFIDPFEEFTNRRNWFLVLVFVLFYKLSDAYLGPMSTPFFLKMGFSKLEIAKIVKTYGLAATLLGTFLGGYLVRFFSIYVLLFWGAVIASVSNLAYILQFDAGYDIKVLMLVIGLENLASGISSAIFVAYLGIICNKEFTATQFALLTSLSAVSRTTLAATSGIVAETVGWVDFFIFSAILCLPALVLIKWINKQ